MSVFRWDCTALACALVLLPLSANGMAAQVPEQRSDAFWVSAGVGRASVGLASGLGLSYRSGPHLVSARLLGGGPVDPFGTRTGTDVGEISIMYGRAGGGAVGVRSISAGVGLVSGEHRRRGGGFSPQVEEFGPTVGIPIEAQFIFSPIRFLGVGVTGFANLNAEASFAGALLSLHLGKLR